MKITTSKLLSLSIIFLLLLVASLSCKKDDDLVDDTPELPTSVTDADGNVYAAVTIGTQVWMAQNLKTTKYSNGTAIPHVSDNTQWNSLTTAAYCIHDNNVSNVAIYGLLYNHFAVDTSILCPTGWKVPSDAEWYQMEHFVDPSVNDPNIIDDRGVNLGQKLKATSGWNQNGNGTDNFGFKALPGGTRSLLGSFHYVGDYGYWWTASEFNQYNAYGRSMFWNNLKVRRDNFPKNNAFSVRCIYKQ
ncbi:MAG: FISUMP domain-containing protein [Bacteroidales bacterium]|nr:FISUMP domain-containing protein [Bacteroidales bacterium]